MTLLVSKSYCSPDILGCDIIREILRSRRQRVFRQLSARLRSSQPISSDFPTNRLRFHLWKKVDMLTSSITRCSDSSTESKQACPAATRSAGDIVPAGQEGQEGDTCRNNRRVERRGTASFLLPVRPACAFVGQQEPAK